MSTGKNFQRVAEELRGGGAIFVVDASGNIHGLSADTYAALTTEQFEGSRVFFGREEAEKFSKERSSARRG